jgi:hypothetical protein
MFAMNAEFLGSHRTAISAEDRHRLMNGQLSPHTWKVWIGHYRRGDWLGAWAHNMMTVGSEEVPEPTPDGLPIPNTQTTSLVVGELYAHVFSSPYPEAVAPVSLGDRASRILVQIWPVRGELTWPLPETITDRDADNFVDAIFNLLYRIGSS